MAEGTTHEPSIVRYASAKAPSLDTAIQRMNLAEKPALKNLGYDVDSQGNMTVPPGELDDNSVDDPSRRQFMKTAALATGATVGGFAALEVVVKHAAESLPSPESNLQLLTQLTESAFETYTNPTKFRKYSFAIAKLVDTGVTLPEGYTIQVTVKADLNAFSDSGSSVIGGSVLHADGKKESDYVVVSSNSERTPLETMTQTLRKVPEDILPRFDVVITKPIQHGPTGMYQESTTWSIQQRLQGETGRARSVEQDFHYGTTEVDLQDHLIARREENDAFSGWSKMNWITDIKPDGEYDHDSYNPLTLSEYRQHINQVKGIS